MSITQERAERIARAHACVGCQEYTYRRLVVREAIPALKLQFGEVWHAELVCGVCGAHQELGIDDHGDVVYVA